MLLILHKINCSKLKKTLQSVMKMGLGIIDNQYQN